MFAAWLGGCGGRSTYEFDELDLTPAHDELSEFSLGHYAIPMPTVKSYGPGGNVTSNHVEFAFELHALVTRDYEAKLSALWERHRGNIRDRVIRVCRNATLEELREPEFAMLKARLTDAIQAELGRRSIRRLLLTDVAMREI